MDILEQVQTCNLYVCILHQFCASLLFIYFLKLIITKIYIKINIHIKKIEMYAHHPTLPWKHMEDMAKSASWNL